jgi:hypothetical protein
MTAISWREQITFQREDYDALFILDQQAYLDCYSASSLKHIRNTQYKDMKWVKQ